MIPLFNLIAMQGMINVTHKYKHLCEEPPRPAQVVPVGREPIAKKEKTVFYATPKLRVDRTLRARWHQWNSRYPEERVTLATFKKWAQPVESDSDDEGEATEAEPEEQKKEWTWHYYCPFTGEYSPDPDVMMHGVARRVKK